MGDSKKLSARVEDVVRLLEDIAPSYLSEGWDNCGLQVGSLQWPVKKVRVALDPLLSVIEDAGRRSVDMVITHHPLIFKGLKRVDLETMEGRVIARAVRDQIAICAAHTNLDSAAGGVNDVLAQKIGLCHLSPLVAPSGSDGPSGGADSFVTGIGRVGRLQDPVPVQQWAAEIKNTLGLQYARVAGNADLLVQSAAVCSGSGGSLMGDFLRSDAQVFVSGDLRYHDARTVEDADRAFIDIGHFASEHIVLDALASRLIAGAKASGWDIEFESCKTEKDPFRWV